MENKLPKNWVETDLEHLFNLVYGKGLSVSELLDEGFDVYGANGIIGKYDKFTYEKSKVIISCRGAASGAIHKTRPQSFITSNSIVLDEVSYELLNLDFVKYAMTIADKSDVITGTAQPQITIQLLKYLNFPLPPLAEQNRIVAKLDALFAQHKAIKTSLAKIPELLKNFRQQVLTQAVTGKLTEEWRKGKELEKWKYKRLEKITSKIGSGSTPTGGQAAYQDEGIPLIRSMNVHFNGIKYEGLAFLNENQAYGLRNVEVFENDILLNITGASIGRVCLAPKEIVGARVNQHVCIIRANEEIKPSFLNIYLSSSIIQDLINNENYGVTRQSFTKAQILELQIPIPLIEEQNLILLKVESLFTKADAIEQQYKNLKTKIDTLPQAILQKAFKGELSDQLATDGDAKELLEEIMKLKEEQLGKKKPKAIKAVSKKVKLYPENDKVLGKVAED